MDLQGIGVEVPLNKVKSAGCGLDVYLCVYKLQKAGNMSSIQSRGLFICIWLKDWVRCRLGVCMSFKVGEVAREDGWWVRETGGGFVYAGRVVGRGWWLCGR